MLVIRRKAGEALVFVQGKTSVLVRIKDISWSGVRFEEGKNIRFTQSESMSVKAVNAKIIILAIEPARTNKKVSAIVKLGIDAPPTVQVIREELTKR